MGAGVVVRVFNGRGCYAGSRALHNRLELFCGEVSFKKISGIVVDNVIGIFKNIHIKLYLIL